MAGKSILTSGRGDRKARGKRNSYLGEASSGGGKKEKSGVNPSGGKYESELVKQKIGAPGNGKTLE